jgi:hypothetical protein
VRLLILGLAAAGLGLAAAGCGGNLLQTQGRVLKGGQPLIPRDGEAVQVTFVPIAADGKPPVDFYYAEVDQATGTFRPAGKDKKGMPPGKYRVAVELKKNRKDVLNGRFGTEKSPFVFDVDATTREIVIDLDSPPKT